MGGSPGASGSNPEALSLQQGGGRSGAGGRRTQSCGGLSWRAQGERDSRVEDGSRYQAGPQGPGKEARLCYEGHVLMDNRQGLVVDVKITEATGTSDTVEDGEGFVGPRPWGRVPPPTARTCWVRS